MHIHIWIYIYPWYEQSVRVSTTCRQKTDWVICSALVRHSHKCCTTGKETCETSEGLHVCARANFSVAVAMSWDAQQWGNKEEEELTGRPSSQRLGGPWA